MNTFFLTKEGGLFDFDLTLPLVIAEFTFLYFFLQRFLFDPILTTIENRRSYINEISGEIAFISNQTNLLVSRYDSFVSAVRSNLRLDVVQFSQACDQQLMSATNSIIERNQQFLKLFEQTMLYSVPIRAKKISVYSFSSEENLMEKALSYQGENQ